MLTVALLGADGAGKTTVGRRLADELSVPVRYIYMGVNGAAATHGLPTTRLVRRVKRAAGRATPEGGPPPVPDVAEGAQPADGAELANGVGDADRAAVRRTPARRALRSLRAAASTANRIAEESYQLAVGRWHVARGRVVVFDRYAGADYWAHDMATGRSRPWHRRVHGAFLRVACREPDAVIVLDAPPALLFSRKGEGTLASLEARRSEYLAYCDHARHGIVIDASAPLEDVVAAVVDVIETAVRRRSGLLEVAA